MNIEENAQIYATSAEDLAKYTRDAEIAEATYTVLIEQVESQSLAAGFQPETLKYLNMQHHLWHLVPIEVSFGSQYSSWSITRGTLALMNSVRRNVYYKIHASI